MKFEIAKYLSPKLVLLDFDGTMLESTGAWAKVYQKFCEENKLTFILQVSHFLDNHSFQDWIVEIINTYRLGKTYQSLMTDFNFLATDVYCNLSPKRGLEAFIKQCNARGATIVVISREEPELINTWLKYYQIYSVSEVVQDKSKNRTASDFYIDFSNALNCKVHDVVVFDDSFVHCKAAQKAEMFTVGMNDNHSFDRQCQMKQVCDLYIDDFTTLLM